MSEIFWYIVGIAIIIMAIPNFIKIIIALSSLSITGYLEIKQKIQTNKITVINITIICIFISIFFLLLHEDYKHKQYIQYLEKEEQRIEAQKINNRIYLLKEFIPASFDSYDKTLHTTSSSPFVETAGKLNRIADALFLVDDKTKKVIEDIQNKRQNVSFTDYYVNTVFFDYKNLTIQNDIIILYVRLTLTNKNFSYKKDTLGSEVIAYKFKTDTNQYIIRSISFYNTENTFISTSRPSDVNWQNINEHATTAYIYALLQLYLNNT